MNTARQNAEDAAHVAVIQAQELLRSTDADELLRKSHQLTHRMHVVQHWGDADLRAQRDLIDAELLRRIGEHR